MSMRRGNSACAAAALAAGSALWVATPAEAAVSDFCDPGYVCVYDGANWADKIATWLGSGTGNRVFPDNRASSWQNHSRYNWCTRNSVVGPDVFVFEMFQDDSNSFVGASRNDKADYAYRC
jgi:hypothetical protein